MKFKSVLLSAIVVFSSSTVVRAVPLMLDVKNGDSFGRTVKDLVVIVKNGTITGVTDHGAFSTPPDNSALLPGVSSVKLDGATLGVGVQTSITLEVSSANLKTKFTKVSFLPKNDLNGNPLPTERTTSDKDDIFSTSVFGGISGNTFAGVPIPARQWGYFYQFDRNSSFAQSPVRFEIAIGEIGPTASGFLRNTWSVASLLDDLPQDIVSGVLSNISDDMIPANLTGIAGIAPDSWSFSNGKMIGTYSTTFNVDDVASVLWIIHPGAPEIGGLLGIGGNNASIFGDGGQLLFENGTLGPFVVPEPGTLLLLATGLVVGLLRKLATTNKLKPKLCIL